MYIFVNDMHLYPILLIVLELTVAHNEWIYLTLSNYTVIIKSI